MYPTQNVGFCKPRRKKVPQQTLFNTHGIFNENISGVRLDFNDLYSHGLPDKENKLKSLHLKTPLKHNIRYPYYIRCIQGNVRTQNEPICYIGTENVMDDEDRWWPRGPSWINVDGPANDYKTTQRSDFQKLRSSMSLISRHSCNPSKVPVSGIVPLAAPKTPSHLPKLLQEQISFQHSFHSRRWSNEPTRGKRQGAFIWTELPSEVREPPTETSSTSHRSLKTFEKLPKL